MTYLTQEAKDALRRLYSAHFKNELPATTVSEGEAFVFGSAPGRVELAGNHTDHQGGRTISAAINQRAYGLATLNGTDEIRVVMDGFGEAIVRLNDLAIHHSETGTSSALVRGMAAAYARSGKSLQGFNMTTVSDIPAGCGLSSSAAFEMLLGATMRILCDPAKDHGTLNPTELALEGVWAERTYFGKPCGAQDQLTSAHGGILAMDFSGTSPKVTPIACDFDAHGFALCLIDSRCDHSRYNNEYAAVPADMHAVAQHFNGTVLEEVPYATLLASLPRVRFCLGDRAVLRALHYFEETQRVHIQQQALQTHDFETFLDLMNASGTSSAQFLQNVSPHADASGADQPAMVILALCAHLLDGHSKPLHNTCAHSPRTNAYRIHGGGFGGSVLAIVPRQKADSFAAAMNNLLNYDACTLLLTSTLGTQMERLGS